MRHCTRQSLFSNARASCMGFSQVIVLHGNAPELPASGRECPGRHAPSPRAMHPDAPGLAFPRNQGMGAPPLLGKNRPMRLLLAALLLCSAFLAQAAEIRTFWRGEFILSDAATPPAADDPGWHPVELPHALRTEAPLARGGWYRFRAAAERPPQAPVAVHVWWLNLNAAFYWNGVYLGDGGRFEEPMARNWNRPFLFLIPDALWRTGENVLHIRLRSDPGWGLLSPVELGDHRYLREGHELRRFLQVELTQSLTLMLFLAAPLILLVWWRRRREAQYLWFGLACLLWGVFASYLVVREPWIPGPLFRWLGHLALDAWAVCMVLFVLRYLGLRRPRLEHALAGFPLLAGVLSALPWFWQGYVFLVTHLITFGLIVWLAWLAGRDWMGGGRHEHGLLLLGLGMLVLAGAHDFLAAAPWWHWLPEEKAHLALKYRLILFNHAAPVVLLFLSGHLGRRFAAALDEAETLNRELEQRVEANRRALAESYERRAALERDTARAEERESIYRDLHDDIGAKLLTLAIRAPDPQSADVARSALQDLRDVVSRSGATEVMLLDLLADRRSEIEARCASAHLRLVWNQPDSLPDWRMSASQALHLGRILREAISNVLRHAGADSVVVSIHHVQDGYRLAVEDDGRKPMGKPGRGMRNMRARAEHLGGGIEWIKGERGCRVELALPVNSWGNAD